MVLRDNMIALLVSRCYNVALRSTSYQAMRLHGKTTLLFSQRLYD